MDYIFKMQDLGHPLTPGELRLKVALATQCRKTPWSATGVPGKGWLRRFKRRHSELATRRSQGLEVARARALCPATAETLYTNLEYLYTSYNYPPNHIWNCDESGVQAGRSGGATVLAKRGSRSVHSIEPDQREHLSALSCINADGGSIPNFYILKGKYFLEDYVARCEEGAVMGMQPNAWMTKWLFESWISHFIECLRGGPGLSQTNRHLLILDGHNSHVTLEVVKISMESGLDIVSLPSHTSHALQPLDVACFKPFKTTFRKIRDSWTVMNKNKRVSKQDLCEWTSKALKAALTPTNIKVGFKKTGIWPLDRTAAVSMMSAASGFEEGHRTGPGGEQIDPLAEKTGQPDNIDDVNGAADSDSDSETDLDSPSGDEGVEVEQHIGDEQTEHDVLGLRPVHYYVDIPDGHESMYSASERNVRIDPEFQAHLQEEHEEDISTFLALPEIIPAKKRKRQQPLLDFTRSKILTSATYTQGCERLLAQREALANEAKRKAAEREATKEMRRKQKEDHQLQIRQRKAERELKRQERQRLEAERRVASNARQRRSDHISRLQQPQVELHTSALPHAPLQHIGSQIHTSAPLQHNGSMQHCTSQLSPPLQNVVSSNAHPGCTSTSYNIPPMPLNSQIFYNPLSWTFPPPSPTFTLHEASNGQGTNWIPTAPATHMPGTTTLVNGTRDRGERGSAQ